jgi:hypothetical protein
MATLARLVGRARALEILWSPTTATDRNGYVNRLVADDEVDRIASRLACFHHEATARTKSYVDQVTLPPDSEFAPTLTDFFNCSGAPPSRRSSRGSPRSGSTRPATSNAPSVAASSRRFPTRELRPRRAESLIRAARSPVPFGSGSPTSRIPCAGATPRCAG